MKQRYFDAICSNITCEFHNKIIDGFEYQKRHWDLCPKCKSDLRINYNRIESEIFEKELS